jgi:hypothetical protein
LGGTADPASTPLASQETCVGDVGRLRGVDTRTAHLLKRTSPGELLRIGPLRQAARLGAPLCGLAEAATYNPSLSNPIPRGVTTWLQRGCGGGGIAVQSSSKRRSSKRPESPGSPWSESPGIGTVPQRDLRRCPETRTSSRAADQATSGHHLRAPRLIKPRRYHLRRSPGPSRMSDHRRCPGRTRPSRPAERSDKRPPSQSAASCIREPRRPRRRIPGTTPRHLRPGLRRRTL